MEREYSEPEIKIMQLALLSNSGKKRIELRISWGRGKDETNRSFPFFLLEMNPGTYHSSLIMFERLSLKVSKVILPKVGMISLIIPVFFIMILRLSYLQNQSKAPLKSCSAANNKTSANKPIFFVTGEKNISKKNNYFPLQNLM